MKHRILTVTPKPGCNPEYPFVIVGGKWLKAYGFTIGGKVLVKCKRGVINIRIVEHEKKEVN